jgi:predicted phage terminase large subunit-like protein
VNLHDLAGSPDGETILASLTPAELAALRYAWPFWARPEQLAPAGTWRTWLVKAGRGWGKTRVGAEWVRQQARNVGRIALVGPTAADVRDVMVEGDSGIMSICGPHDRPEYQPSRRRLVFPSGALAYCYSADEPERLRGPQHHAAWCDEVGAWRYPEAWDQLRMGLRLGSDPRAVVTTTPRPTDLMRRIAADPGTVVTRGTTFQNRANLAREFLEAIVTRYEGTRIGRQELLGEDLDDNPAALWQRGEIDANRRHVLPELVRVVVAVDPAVTAGEEADETGIIVVGLGADGHGYVLDDRSMRGSPDAWGREVVACYNRHKANAIVVEVNQGGDLVRHLLGTLQGRLPIREVRASRGKVARAEPVAALYEQGKVHHVGSWSGLEDQLCGWTPGHESPDRMDALVWGITELMLERAAEPGIRRL